MLSSEAKTQNLNMKNKRHTTEEIIRILRKADGEQTVEEVCREFNISEQTFYRWRRKYGRMEIDWDPVNWPIANEMVFRENQRNHP